MIPSRWLLTGRGLLMVVIAAAAGGVGYVMGIAGIVYVALFLAAVVVVGIGWALLSRPQLSVTRTDGPLMAPVGTRLDNEVKLIRARGLGATTLMVEEAVPLECGVPVRCAFSGVRRSWSRSLRYHLTPAFRGRYHLGPLSVEVFDPFGVAHSRRSWGGTTEVIVPPAITTLASVPSPNPAGVAAQASFLSHAGTDDVLLREYRSGDDMRRIHWRSSAHTGSLMVRREEPRREAIITVIADNRSAAHPDGPGSDTFEWVAAAAASIAMHYARERLTVRNRSSDGSFDLDAGSTDMTGIMAWYADLTESAASGVLGGERMDPHFGHVFAVTGVLTGDDHERLLSAAGPRPGTALVCTSDDSDEDTRTAVEALTSAGWTVVRTDAGADLDAVWAHLLAGGNTL